MVSPSVMALVALVVALVGIAFRLGMSYARRGAGGRSRPLPGSQDKADELEPELLAVIAAAAREVLQAPVRVHRVHVHRGPLVEHWSRAGRMDIMISHRVEPKR